MRGWAQSDLAHRLGLRPGVVGRWWHGTQPPDSDYCQLIADVMGLDEALVLQRAGHLRDLPVAPDVYETIGTLRVLREKIDIMEGRLAADEIDVPFRGLVPADTLRWTQAESEDVSVRVSRRLVGARPASHLFAVAVSGDCLGALRIQDGDTVYCERVDRRPRNGEIVVVRLADEVTMKVWRQDGAIIRLSDGSGLVVRELSALDDFTVEGIAIAREGPIG